MDAANDISSCIDPAFLSAPQPPVVLSAVPISVSKVFRPKQHPISQPELWLMAESGLIPPHLDRRSEGDAIAMGVLAHGARLGAVRLLP